MKNIFTLLIFAALIFAAGSCEQPIEIKPLSFLHTQGTDIVNDNGEKVILRSVGLKNWTLPEGSMWQFGEKVDSPHKIEALVEELIGADEANEFWNKYRANYITEADIIRIKELGFNAVRPTLNGQLFLNQDDNEGFILLENLVNWCRKHQLYVIIDLYSTTGDDAFVKLWATIAEKYKDDPTIAAYDILNEPLHNKNDSLAEPLYKKLTSEIRKKDQKHMITLAGIEQVNNWDIFSEAFDDNTFYQFHYYCSDTIAKLKDINYFLTKRDELGVPIWVGETGDRNATVYWGATQTFEQHNVGWSFWAWKKMEENSTPYAINKPEGWDEIIAYSKGGEKPSKQFANKAFDMLLDNIKLDKCVYSAEVLQAIFRQIPGKVEVENYMKGAYAKTWLVKDTTDYSKYYRTNEFVPIEIVAVDTVSNKMKWDTEFCVTLSKEEWVKCTVNSSESRKFDLKIRCHVEELPSKIVVQCNGKGLIVEPEQLYWNEIDYGKIDIKEGENKILIKVVNGKFKVDWIILS